MVMKGEPSKIMSNNFHDKELEDQDESIDIDKQIEAAANNPNTNRNTEPSKQKRGYKPVQSDQRNDLIHLFNNGKTIKDAAKILEINYSTAKHIIKQYKSSNQYLSDR